MTNKTQAVAGTDKPASRIEKAFMKKAQEHFTETINSYGFSKTRQKELVKTFEKVMAVISAHGRFHSLGKGEPTIELGLKGINNTDILGVDNIVSMIIKPSFNLSDFVKEILDITEAEIKGGGSVFLCFKNGRGYITDPRLDQKFRLYSRISGAE